MLSVAKCGYDNEYGNKYMSKHLPEDLKLLKDNESLITVKGGEHIGKLYGMLIAVPASLDTEARLFYESINHLFKFNDVEATIKKYKEIYKNFSNSEEWLIKFLQEQYSVYADYRELIILICDVMIRNYSIYSTEIWEENEKELFLYSKNIEDIFNKNELSEKLENITNEKLETDFIATFCNSLDGGAEAIDISENQDVFGIGRNYEWAEKFISHEFIIYLLKQSLINTTAFKDLKYWLYTECLAEFYLSLAGKSGGFTEGQDVIVFYNKLYQENNALSAPELYNRAIEKFINNIR